MPTYAVTIHYHSSSIGGAAFTVEAETKGDAIVQAYASHWYRPPCIVEVEEVTDDGSNA